MRGRDWFAGWTRLEACANVAEGGDGLEESHTVARLRKEVGGGEASKTCVWEEKGCERERVPLGNEGA